MDIPSVASNPGEPMIKPMEDDVYKLLLEEEIIELEGEIRVKQLQIINKRYEIVVLKIQEVLNRWDFSAEGKLRKIAEFVPDFTSDDF